IRPGGTPQGKWWNLIEGLVTFVRSEIALPNLHGDTDKYMPLLWTMFFFILICNLIGLVPFFGSPTASIFMTAGLSLFTLIVFHFRAILKLGTWTSLKSMWPVIEIVPYPLAKPGGGHGHGHGHHDDAHGHVPAATAATATPPPTGIKLVGQMALWAV